MTIKTFANKAWATRNLNAIMAQYGDIIVNSDIEQGADGRWTVVVLVAEGSAISPEFLDIDAVIHIASSHKHPMTKALSEARTGYVTTLSHNGRKSADTNDEVAVALRGMSPEMVCALADLVLGTLALGEVPHSERYGHLNPGQQRMNAGNRIRALVKRGGIAPEDFMAYVQQVEDDFAQAAE